MSRLPPTFPTPPLRREPQLGQYEALETSDRAFTLAQRKRDIAKSLDSLRNRLPKARRILPNGQREMGVAKDFFVPA